MQIIASIVAAVGVLSISAAAAQTLTGALIGTVKDEQGLALGGALVRVTSPALMGGSATIITTDSGRLRFPILPPGTYALDVELIRFASHRAEGIVVTAGGTIERNVVLNLAGLVESIDVGGAVSSLEARDSG